VPEEIMPDHDNTYDYVNGWNNCRAAMLRHQPVNEQEQWKLGAK